MTIACLCVLLGGPSYSAGAESLIIAGATYYEPGVSGPGWAWTDADHLELNGYAGEAIGAGPGVGVRVYGVCLQNAGLGDGTAGCRLSVDVSWLDAIGADSGAACTGGLLVFAWFVTPAGCACVD